MVVLSREIPPAAGHRQDERPPRPPILRMAGLGFLGGVMAGAAVAAPFYLALNDSGCDICTGLVIAVPAVWAAYSAGQALGVHLGNGRRGNFLADFGVSLLGSAAGGGLGALAGADEAIIGAALFGLVATIWMEVRSSR